MTERKSTIVKKQRREVGTTEYLGFVRRAIRAAALRVGDGDVEAFGELMTIRDDLDLACRVAVAGLRSNGETWEEIGRMTGVTRQAALMRWGPKL